MHDTTEKNRLKNGKRHGLWKTDIISNPLKKNGKKFGKMKKSIMLTLTTIKKNFMP